MESERTSADERQCSSAEEIAAYADGEVSAETKEQFEIHASECDDCRSALAMYVRMTAAGETEEESALVDALADETAPLARELARGAASGVSSVVRRGPWRAVSAPWLAVAAGLLVAGALTAVWLARPSESSDLARGTAALDAVLAESRPTQLRLAGAPYAPFTATRGVAESKAESAELYLRAAVAERPTPEARRQLARALLVNGDAAAARDQLEVARREDPGNVDVAVDYAVARAEGGDLEAALGILSAVLAAHPDRADALFDRAVVNARLGRAAGARADFERYLALDPSSPWAGEARSFELKLNDG